MKDKKNDKSKLKRIIIIVILNLFLALIFMISTVFNGITDEYINQIGILSAIIFTYTFIVLRKKYKNIGVFLLFVFSAFWLIPTVEFDLYKTNNNYYQESTTFKENQKKFATELSNNKINFKDLNNIQIEIEKIIESKKEETTNKSRDISQILNLVKIDSLFIPELVELSCERDNSFISQGVFSFTLKTRDSLETILKIKSEFPWPSDSEIIEKIEFEKSQQLNYEKTISGQNRIYYSQFLIEAITCFSSGDISPSRNIVKLINGLEGLLLLFITTILINSVGSGLKIEKK
jgi:4-amino-4-deoxy-L-arabinose transferase-like glycosyltransferase